MKPELSTEFDSDLQFVDPLDFNGVIMDSVEIFGEAEYSEIVERLQGWDTPSLYEIQDEITGFLTTRKPSCLKLSLNTVLDHCTKDGKPEEFKIWFLTNITTWLIYSREAQMSPPFEGEIKGFGEAE
jgi:hypothetical protein